LHVSFAEDSLPTHEHVTPKSERLTIIRLSTPEASGISLLPLALLITAGSSLFMGISLREHLLYHIRVLLDILVLDFLAHDMVDTFSNELGGHDAVAVNVSLIRRFAFYTVH
jgi:hypothetical protein